MNSYEWVKNNITVITELNLRQIREWQDANPDKEWTPAVLGWHFFDWMKRNSDGNVC